MRESRFTEEQIIAALKEHEAGAKVRDLWRRSPRMARGLCSLSQAETSLTDAEAPATCAMYLSLRDFHGGFGISSVSLHASTMSAAASPKRWRIAAAIG